MDALSTKALSFLTARGFEATPLPYKFVMRGGTRDAARKLGVSEHQVVKSLVFDNGMQEDSFKAVMALMHGDERVSMHKLERLAGIRHLAPSSPETALSVTGYMPGGICPFCLRTEIPVIMQQSLAGEEFLYINAGLRGLVARIRPSALLLVHPLAGDIRSESSSR